MYKKGLHIIASINNVEKKLLLNYSDIQQLINEAIEQLQLQKLGEVYHAFSEGGFTLVVCLSESHISVHTWPEHNLVNLDIYLSNFLHSNENKVELIYEKMKELFGGTITQENKILR